MLTKFKLIRRRTGEGRKEIAGYDLVIVKARYQGRDSLYLYVCLKIFHSKTIFISVKINHFSISHVHSLIFNPPTTSISNSFSVSLPWIHCNKAKFYLCRMQIPTSEYKLQPLKIGTQMVKNLPAMRKTQVRSLGWGRSPGEGNGNALQYSCPENPMNKRAWQATIHGAAKSQT